MITPYTLSGILIALTSFSFGLLVFLKSSDRKVGRIWFLFSLATTLWGVSCIAIGLAKTVYQGLISYRLAFACSIVWIPALFYHFVHQLCEKVDFDLRLAQYLVALFLFLFSPTAYFYAGVRKVFPDFYAPIPGPLFHLFMIWWIITAFLSHAILIKSVKNKSPIKKNQIKFFLLASLVGFTGGSLNYLPDYQIDIYPWGNFAVVFYPLIMSYAMLKYRLMDVRIFVRRTALVMGIYLVLTICSLPLIFMINEGHGLTHKFSTPILIYSLGFFLSLGPFLYAYLVRKSSYFHENTMAGLTHELKSPLASIQSAIEILQEETQEMNLPPKYKSYVEMISRNTDRLSSFVNDLLHVFKHVEKTELILEEIDVNQFVSHVLKPYQALAETHGNQLELALSNDIPPIQVDPIKLETVISNILSNACKFTKNGTIKVSTYRRENQLFIQTTDTGTGIHKEDLPYIFDRFFQSKRSPNLKGTGIGLSLAKLWTEAHHGKIWADSEGKEKGTMVTVMLPI